MLPDYAWSVVVEGMLDRFLSRLGVLLLVFGVGLLGCSDDEPEQRCKGDECACEGKNCEDASVPPSSVEAGSPDASGADAGDAGDAALGALTVVGRVLPPLAQADVEVTVRGETKAAATTKTSDGDYEQAGFIAFSEQQVDGLDDDATYVITVRGGRQVAADDKTKSNETTLHVVVTGRELKRGGVNVSIATELVFVATVTLVLDEDDVSSKKIRQAQDKAAKVLLGSDLDGDDDIDYADVLAFDPSKHGDVLLVPPNALTIPLLVEGKETTLAEALESGNIDDINAAFDALLDLGSPDAGVVAGPEDPDAGDAAVIDAPCWSEFADCSDPARPLGPVCLTCEHPLMHAGASMGDPHLRTFDGLAYDMQGVGEFILVASTTDTLEVQVRTAPWGERTDVAVNTAFAARVASDRVTFGRDGVVRINGEVRELEEGWTPLTEGRVYRFGSAYTLEWADGSQVRARSRGPFLELEVLLVEARRGQVVGLLGSFDGTVENELANRNGQPLPEVVEFSAFYEGYVESWRIKQEESLFDYAAEENTETFTNRAFPTVFVSASAFSEEAAFAMCESLGVTSEAWQNACAMDLTIAEDPAFAEGLARLAPAMVTFELQPPPTESEVLDFPEFVPEPDDEVAFGVVQTLPPNSSTGVDPKTTIVVFFDDSVDPRSVNDVAITVKTASDEAILGRYSGGVSESGNTVLYFQPFRALPGETTIIVTLTAENGLLDNGGNPLSQTYEFSFTTSAATVSPEDLGFEATPGWSFAGDGAIVDSESLGSLFGFEAKQGEYVAAISTDYMFSGSALGGTTSSVTSGPLEVPEGTEQLVFDFNFLSAEFDSWVGQTFDDVLTVTVSGPTGATSRQLASVNAVGIDASTPTEGTSSVQETGWQEAQIDVEALGSPLTISFTVSDVGDAAYVSIGLIDAIRFE